MHCCLPTKMRKNLLLVLVLSPFIQFFFHIFKSDLPDWGLSGQRSLVLIEWCPLSERNNFSWTFSEMVIILSSTRVPGFLFACAFLVWVTKTVLSQQWSSIAAASVLTSSCLSDVNVKWCKIIFGQRLDPDAEEYSATSTVLLLPSGKLYLSFLPFLRIIM